MATCTLIFEDADGGEVTAEIRFSPPLPDGPPAPLLTNAQQIGMRMLEASFAALCRMEQGAAQAPAGCFNPDSFDPGEEYDPESVFG